MKEKEGNERIFEVMPEYVTLKQGARDRLLRPEGIEMRVNQLPSRGNLRRLEAKYGLYEVPQTQARKS